MFFTFFTLYCVLIQFAACEYSYMDLPVEKGGTPLVVESLLTLEKISSFNLKELEFSMIYFQEQFWKIRRDKCDHFYLDSLKDYLNVTVLAGQRAPRKYNINLSHISKLNLWIPNSFQIDSKSITKIPPQNELIELELTEDFCYFNLKTRLSVRVGCQMYFRNYPNDIQICPFRLTSYTYPLESVVYKWREPGVITRNLVHQINQYTLQLKISSYNSTKYDERVHFSFLEISFRFENHLSHYLMQIVLPTYFIISIVYLNLWMKPDGSPGRFLLTILTFICLVTIYNANRDKLPALAYANAVDVWMLSNLFFVLASISELVIHSFIAKRRAKKEQEAAKAKQSRAPSSEIYIITPDHPADCISMGGKFDNDRPTFMCGADPQKSHENLHSDVTVEGSSNNLLTLNGKPEGMTRSHSLASAALHSTIHSSIENVLNYQSSLNRMRRAAASETQVEAKKHPFDLDRMCRWLFPAAYLLFNVIYWVMLLNRWFDAPFFRLTDSS